MYLIVGATSKLGRPVIRKLRAQHKPVRAMTRTPDQAEDLLNLGAEVVPGDLRDPGSLIRACQGVEKVLAAAHAFPGEGDNNPETVDKAGNRSLIDAAKAAGVKHFVFTSGLGVGPDKPLELFSAKYVIEQYLQASGLDYTILRPSAFMEFWAALVGEPIIKAGKTTIFGQGDNPINFVSVDDVARFALIGLDGPRAVNQAIDIGGPENLTFNQVAKIFEDIVERPAQKRHIPLLMLRTMYGLTRVFNRPMSRLMQAAIAMDTLDWSFEASATLARYPMQLTRLEEVARRLVQSIEEEARYKPIAA